jgi:integrase
MPIPELMTWVPSRRRWTRMHKGQRFWISCKALGVPATKEASIHAANAWWTAKQAELDAAEQCPVHPKEELVAALLGVEGGRLDRGDILRLAFRQARERLAEYHKFEELRDNPPPPPDENDDVSAEERAAARQRIIDEELGRWIRSQLEQPASTPILPPHAAERLSPATVHVVEKSVAGLRGESTTPADRTVQAHAKAWHTLQEAQAAAGQVTAARVNNVRMALAHFEKYLGSDADVGAIDAASLQGFYTHCLGMISARRSDSSAGWSTPFAKEVFAVARAWLRWLTEQGIIDPPRNLASRFRFGSTAKRVHTWTPAEARHVIGEAPGKLKLALLLMLNCGMTQRDISDLKDSEVDWRAGRIIRERSKTAGHASTPTVNYKLWPLTRKLLREHRSGSERVLLTASGKPYVRSEMVKGKLVKADGFKSNYAHLQRRLKFKKPMKLLRKTAASILESHETYGRLTSLFLGHAPSSVKDRHYAAPPQALLDEAVLWLGMQLGLA